MLIQEHLSWNVHNNHDLSSGSTDMAAFLKGLPAQGLGRKFLIISRKAAVETFMKAVR